MIPVAWTALGDGPALPFTGTAIALFVIALLSAVIVHRLVFDRVRRRGGQLRESPTIAIPNPSDGGIDE